MSKIYFVPEGEIFGVPFVGSKITSVYHPERKETVLKDVFEIKDSNKFGYYKYRSEFVALVYEMVLDTMGCKEILISDLRLLAVDREDNNILWAIEMHSLNEEAIEYRYYNANEKLNFRLYKKTYISINSIVPDLDRYHTQWLPEFVKNVIAFSDISCCGKVTVCSVQDDDFINIAIDNHPYTICTESFKAMDEDDNGLVCSEDVHYSIYETIYNPSKKKPKLYLVDSGRMGIEWEN